VVGADGRLSSPDIVGALIDGLISTGREVINIGFVPTPLLYYATHNSEATSGVMVTGSHNPADHNGMKIVLAGQALMGDGIQKLFTRYQDQDFVAGDGDVTEIDIREDYMDAITDDVVVAQPLKVVVDCGNGIAGDILPTLLGNLGCDVVEMYCDVDGNFPNHHPDPTVPANLEDLIITVRSEEADLGIALDGDGDRLVAVTAEGEIVWPDRLLMLFAKDVVSRNPGSDVVYDVKCTRHLNSVISGFGGRPVMCRSGHSYIKAKMKETDAILGGEMSGHICFKERWFGFDDGLYSTARLLEIVGSQSEGLSELLEQFPASISTPEIKIPVTESHKFDIVAKLIESADFGDATMTNIDGLRVDFAEGWGLVRASNTTACLTLRFEADDNASLEDIQNLFREKLKEVQASLTF
jgi:phosphomannomutase/phosphoglucomutase